MSLYDLPNELIMELISWLPLKSLIAVQGVNQKWRDLLPLSPLLPARRSLLALYLVAITHHPTLDRRNSYKDAHFNRASYLAALTRSNDGEALPEEFRVWVLEWPYTVMNWFWPGHHLELFRPSGLYGTKSLSYRRTSLSRTVVRDIAACGNDKLDSERVMVNGLTVWVGEDGSTVQLVTGGTNGKEYLKGTMHTFFHLGLERENEIVSSWAQWLAGTVHDEHWIHCAVTSTGFNHI